MEADLSTLCMRCGLCCDGSLFSHVPLLPAEASRLRPLGVGVVEQASGARVLPQRCAALRGTCCTVYTERPEGCRRYRCLLLGALVEGEVSLEEALGVVAQAHARVVEAGAALGLQPEEGSAVGLAQRVRTAHEQAQASPASAEAHAAWERAGDFFDRHFRGRHRRYR